jgi:glutaminase
MNKLVKLTLAPRALSDADTQAIDAREHRLFQALDVDACGTVEVRALLQALEDVGLDHDDARLRQTMKAIRNFTLRDKLSYDAFCEVIRPNILLIEQALQGRVVIPDFHGFTQEVERIFHRVEKIRDGEVADYIPQLARVNPDRFGVAICTVDGQRYAIGDAMADFSVQSCNKPVNYCLALEEHGEDGVHNYVGREPSGRLFNELTLNAEGKPHNPMINAGAIMSASLIAGDLDPADRFEHVMDKWQALCGGTRPSFNNAVYQSERKSADRNFALGYHMREQKGFPDNVELLEVLEFYFQCCSIEATSEMMATLAATLANGGVCPITGDRVLRTSTVQNCLSLMCSCGMYDFSGEFAFSVGLPAKSGVGGGLMLVIPNLLGICVWSPRLDDHGNSVRGLAFCKELVESFKVHNYDSFTGVSAKLDPRTDAMSVKSQRAGELIWAASKGDCGAIHRMVVRGFDQNVADYDGRTPMHLAAAEGRAQVVEYFIDNGAAINPLDRWGNTPLDDALRHQHLCVAQQLAANGAKSGGSSDSDLGHVGKQRTPAVGESKDIVEVIYAASEGDLKALQRLVARGAALDGTDYDYRTPLHLAAAEGQEAVVQYLLDHRAPIDSRDRWGGTPLDDARRHGHQRLAALLENQHCASAD